VNLIPKLWTLEDCSDRKLNKTASSQVFLILLTLMEKREEKPDIYIDKDGNPSSKSTRHVDANVDT
jgi:hypothetical protein